MNKIANFFLSIKLKLLLIIVKFVFFYIRKTKKEYYEACYRKLYILANKQFQTNELGLNSDLALELTSLYIDKFGDDGISINKKEIKILKSIADEDDWIKRNISDLYRIISFSCITDSDLKDKYLKKAKQLSPNIKAIENFKEIKSLINCVKKDSKLFLKEGRALSEKKYQEEVGKKINHIEISSQNITFLLTLFSTFFLISGIIYSKFYFYLLGINISDFFSVSDYLASSIDTLIIVFLSILVGMIFYFIGKKDRLKVTVYEEQFNIESDYDKKNLKWIVFISVICLISFFVNYFLNNKVYYYLLYLVIIFGLFRYFWFIPIWKYFKNPEKVGFVLISFLIFIIALIFTALKDYDRIINKKVNDIKYNIVFKNKNHDTDNLIFITSNSSNLFMLNIETKKVEIFPIYNIESIENK